MQVYLPDDLYAMVKDRGLSASQLLQHAILAEVHRQDLVRASQAHTADLTKEVGPPRAAERARAADLVRRITDRSRRKAG